MFINIIEYVLEAGGFIKKCPECGEFFWPWDVESRRLNTAFVKDELNFVNTCPECYYKFYDYYTEMWGQYYGYPT